MTEWILIVAFWMGAAPAPGNMNLAFQPGFRSKLACEEAARGVAEQLQPTGATMAFICRGVVRA